MQKAIKRTAASFLLLMMGALEANAEGVDRDSGVLDRSRPDYDALGIPAGGFTLFPSLRGSIASDDNIFASESPEVNDTSFQVEPVVILQSNWSRHQLVLDAYALSVSYNDNPDEDRFEWGAGVKGQLDISQLTIIRADGHYDR